MPSRASLRRWPLALASTAALALAPTGAAAQFSALYFLGDSFTDTGNVSAFASIFGLTIPAPPYASGRYSNGPLWAEYLADALGRGATATRPSDATATSKGGNNFALAGAKADGAGALPLLETDLGTQLSWLLSRRGPIDPNGLYTMFTGGNDLRSASLLADPAAQVDAAANAALNMGLVAYALGSMGAGTVLVPSLPDMGRLPDALNDPARAATLTGLTGIYNYVLDAMLGYVRPIFPSTTFLGLRLDNLFANILADVAAGGPKYGLTNATTGCFTAGSAPCAVSVFVDGIHPTTAAHRIVAGAAYDRVVNGVDVALDPTFAAAGVGALSLAGDPAALSLLAARAVPGGVGVLATPEPATVALLGAGLAALAVGARRRRARAA
jgi:phospholipase/lecithinase/hemolysin